MDDRRQFPRIPTRLTVELSRPEESDPATTAWALDVSPGGLRLETSDEVTPGQEIELALVVAEGEDPIRSTGLVRWSAPDGANWISGIELRELDESTRQRLRTFLRHLNRRAFPRFPVQVEVRARPPAEERQRPATELETTGADRTMRMGRTFHGVDDFISAYGSDISLGGMRLIAERHLDPGQRIDLEFSLESGNQLLRGLGEVRWCREQANGRFAAGLEFVELDDASRRFLTDMAKFDPRRERALEWLFDVDDLEALEPPAPAPSKPTPEAESVELPGDRRDWTPPDLDRETPLADPGEPEGRWFWLLLLAAAATLAALGLAWLLNSGPVASTDRESEHAALTALSEVDRTEPSP